MIIDQEDYIEHYGVKGMKWGQRRAARSQNRALNKASRAKDRDAHAKTVDKSRDYFESGKAAKEWKTAKTQYKTNKATLGSREAKKILNKTKQKQWAEAEKSQQARDGGEVAKALALGLGATVLLSALSR